MSRNITQIAQSFFKWSNPSYFSFGHQKFQNQGNVPFYAQGTPFVTPLNTFHERQFYQPPESRQNEPTGITNIYFGIVFVALEKLRNKDRFIQLNNLS